MNKALGLCWIVSLIITFYFGYGYNLLFSASATNSVNVIAPDNSERSTFSHSLETAFDLPKQDLATTSNLDTEHHLSAIPSEPNNAPSNLNIDETLEEVTLMLGNGADLAGIAKAYMLINEFSQQDLLTALGQLESSANEQDSFMMVRLLLSKYAERNPRASLAYIDNNLTSSQANLATVSVIATWSKTDANAAYDWYLERKADTTSDNRGSNGNRVLRPIFAELIKQDFHGTIDKLIDISKESSRNISAISGIAQTLKSKEEFTELLSRTSELSNKRVQDTVVNYWVKRDPQEAIEWVDSVADVDDRAKFQEKVMSSWMRSDQTQAADWYIAKAAPENKQAYADKIVSRWSYVNPNKALDWLSGQAEIDQNKSTTKLLKSSVYRNTDFAIEHLDLIDNDKDKLSVSKSIYMALRRTNEEKTAQFIAQSSLKEPLQEWVEKYQARANRNNR